MLRFENSKAYTSAFILHCHAANGAYFLIPRYNSRPAGKAARAMQAKEFFSVTQRGICCAR